MFVSYVYLASSIFLLKKCFFFLYSESEVVLADGGIPNVAVAVEEGLNAYESVDKEKIKPNEEAGTSGDGEPARVDSPPSMPPVYAVVDKKLMKKETSTDEEVSC